MIRKTFSGWLRKCLPRKLSDPPEISDALWKATLHAHPFLAQLSVTEKERLKALCAHFLQCKEFTGANSLVITDAMALSVAAQACVLLIHRGTPQQALRYYNDFVGIVIHPTDMVARRTVRDRAGVIHQYQEALMGEAMERGPVTLSWSAIQPSIQSTSNSGMNVVIHEFAHKLDMANGDADGCPPLPAGFMGLSHPEQARKLWASRWLRAYEDFGAALSAHTRFGQPAPWMDPYAATDPAEFFAVACEAYWVAPEAFTQAMPSLKPLLDALFQRPKRA